MQASLYSARPYDTIDELSEALREADYLPDRGVATALFLILSLEKPVCSRATRHTRAI